MDAVQWLRPWYRAECSPALGEPLEQQAQPMVGLDSELSHSARFAPAERRLADCLVCHRVCDDLGATRARPERGRAADAVQTEVGVRGAPGLWYELYL